MQRQNDASTLIGFWEMRRNVFVAAVLGGGIFSGIAFSVRNIAFGIEKFPPGSLAPATFFGALIAAVFAYQYYRNRNLLFEHRRAEEAALKTKLQFEDFATAASDWFWETDADLRYVEMTGGYEDATGHDRSEWIGTTREETFQQLLTAEELQNQEKWAAHYADLAARKPFRGLTYARRRPDGSVSYTRTSGTPMFDDLGNFTGYRGAASDITDRMVAEKSLAEFSVTLDRAQDCIFTFDPTSLVFMFANQGAAEQVGYSAEELLTMTPLDIKPEYNEKKFKSLIAPLLSGVKKSLTFETNHRHKNGDLIPVEIVLQYLDREVMNPPRFVAVVRDITGRKIVEHELHHTVSSLEEEMARREEAESLLQESIDNISDAFVLYDKNDNFILSNKKFFDFNPALRDSCPPGINFRQMLEMDFERNHYSNTESDRQAWIDQRLREHRDFENDHHRMLPDGRWIQIRNHPTHAGGVVGIRTDVTELKHAVEAAESASRAKSEFLANMSHELRTPLNAVIGYAQLIELEPFGDIGHPRYAEYVRDIHESGEHLLALIDDILDLTRIEAGKMTVQNEMVVINDIVETCVRFLASKTVGRNIRVTAPPANSWPMLRADPRIVRQSLLNLMSNSVKFSLDGARLDISGQLTDDGGLAIVVADTGIGMSAQEIDIAMEQFGQVDTSITRQSEGTGLGLPLVKSLMELHGGTLEIESEKGVGTQAKLIFPPDRVSRV